MGMEVSGRGGGMEHQRWWTAIVAGLRGAERVVVAIFLGLIAVAIITIVSPNSESFKLDVLEGMGVIAALVVVAFILMSIWRPRSQADQVAVEQQERTTASLQTQLHALQEELEQLREWKRRSQRDTLETGGDDHSD
ncbi:MAG: hypothetical protein CL878_02025 [Dehalococcoidia bacterium]|nr:hypothetical protein [Dehalococcoidia bacterium]